MRERFFFSAFVFLVEFEWTRVDHHQIARLVELAGLAFDANELISSIFLSKFLQIDIETFGSTDVDDEIWIFTVLISLVRGRDSFVELKSLLHPGISHDFCHLHSRAYDRLSTFGWHSLVFILLMRKITLNNHDRRGVESQRMRWISRASLSTLWQYLTTLLPFLNHN